MNTVPNVITPYYVRLVLVLGIIHCGLSSSIAQPRGGAQIRGVVVDSITRQPLMEASVTLLLARDSSLVTYGITNGSGEFMFRNVVAGRYRVLVTYVGYRNGAMRVSVVPNVPVTETDTLRLLPQTATLNEVVVQAERAPVAIKGDTLEFNAGSFKTRPNAQVEDLLKKLPGIEVSRDGTIKAQGQEVKKVYLDGKPFFGDDPKVATRNLPADIIDKVQLYDRQSDQSQFSGVDDGDREKTINLTTKRDKRKGTFGQQSLGYGHNPNDGQNPYLARANINHFNNGMQLSVIGLANNLNRQDFTGQDLGLGNNAGGGGGRGMTGGGGGGQGGATPSNITRSWGGGANYHNAWGKKIEVAGSYFLNNTDVLTDQQTLRRNVLADTSFVTAGQNSSRNQNTSNRANLRFDYKLDSLTTLRVTPSLNWQHSQFGSSSISRTTTNAGNPLNSSTTDYSSKGTGFTGSNNALLLRKFKRKGRTFSVNWAINLNDQQSEGLNRSLNTYATAPTRGAGGADTLSRPTSSTGAGALSRAINQLNNQRTYANANTNTITAAYTEPLSLRNTLEFHYSTALTRNTSDRQVTDYNETTSQYDRRNPSLSNQFLTTFLTNRGGITLQTRRLKYNYSVGLDAQQSGLRVDNQTRDTSFTRQFTNLLPNALLTYNFARSRTLRLNYRTRLNAPSVSQLQPVPDNTNPLNIRLGNPTLRPEYSHNLTLTYNNFQQGTFRSLFALITASRTDNKIVNATTFNNVGSQTTKPVNVDGYYTLTGYLAHGRPVTVGSLKANLNLNTNLTYNRGQSFVNNQQNRSQSYLLSQGVSLNSNFTDKLEFSLGGNMSYQTASYSLQPQQNTEFVNRAFTADLYYQLPFRFVLTTDVSYNNYGGKSAGLNQNYTLLNVALARQFFKQRQGELKFQVYDALNQNRSIVRTVTDTYVEEVRSRVLNRYFLLSFTYNLRNFSAGATQSQFRPMNDGRSNRGGRQRF